MPDTDTASVESTTVVAAPKRKLPMYGKIGLAWLIILALGAVFLPMLAADPLYSADGSFVKEGCGDGSGLPIYEYFQCQDTNAVPSAAGKKKNKEAKFTHLLGVDPSGRDVFSGVVAGARSSLMIAFGAIAFAMLVGGSLGLVAGYFGGKVSAAINFLFDVLVAFPQIVLAFSVAAFLQGNDATSGWIAIRNLVLTLGIVASPLLGRITRASTLTWSQREFVTAARAMGARHPRIIVRDIFPNVLPALLSITTLAVGVALVAEGSLAIIGLGLPPGEITSWGSVLYTGVENIFVYSNVIFAPSVCIVLTVMSLNMLGDAIRQKFDVKESAL